MSNENQTNPPLQQDPNPPQQQVKTEEVPIAQPQAVKVQEATNEINAEPQTNSEQKKAPQLAFTEPQPTTSSPRRQILSPKQMAGSRRSQSPVISRGKLEAVKKMLNKQEQKYNKINDELSSLKNQRENLLEEWTNKQNERVEEVGAGGGERKEELTRQANNLREQINELNEKIERARKQAATLLESRQLQKRSVIQKLQAAEYNAQKLQQENNNKAQTHVNQLRAQITTADSRIALFSNILTNQQSKKQGIKARKSNLENSKRDVSNQIQNSNRLQQQERNNEQARKLELQKRIAETKQRINLKKKELTDLKSKDNSKQVDSTQINTQIEQVKNLNKQLGLSIKKAQDQIYKKSKETQNAKEAEKKKEKKISQLKAKVEQSNKRQNQLKEQVAKLDASLGDKNIVRYEEKIPEQLVAVKSKNEDIRRDIKKVIEKCEIERGQIDKLVPPAVIENMNKKISSIISNNDRLTEISKIVEEVSSQNQILVEEREALQWGENNYLKQLQGERKKQQQKNKALDEQLAQKKKHIQQINSKLLQYVQTYPQFKPEKKKKAEPQKAKKEQKPKKGAVIEQNQKPAPVDLKKKKSTDTLNKASSVIEPVDVVVEQPKKQEKGGKKKKKNSDQQQKVQKSPPSEIKPQKSQKIIQAKVEPKIEQKPVQKVEPKVEIKQKQIRTEGEPKKKTKKK